MFKYENNGKFVNDDIDYPFNIRNIEGIQISDFWEEISKLIIEVNDDKFSKVRFIWIDAGNYCQTEIFLKKLLLENHNNYSVLYLHWIDFVNEDSSIYIHLSQEQIEGKYFIDEKDKLKICVIDHAETIVKTEQYFELCTRFKDNKCIFIFVSKQDIFTSSNWKGIIEKAKANDDYDDCNLGIIRSEHNYFVVQPYSIDQCREILSREISNDKIRDKVISIADKLGKELRRPYYFDILIKEINSYVNVSRIPANLEDSFLMVNLLSNENYLEGIIAHLSGYNDLEEYLDGYYESHFVKNFIYGVQSRIPIDNYAWAYGIVHCSQENNYNEVIHTQFVYRNDLSNIDFKGQLCEINERIVLLYYSEKKNIINEKFELNDYFLQMVRYSLDGARVCASVFNKCSEKIDKEICENIFIALAKKYNEKIESKDDIRIHYMLGMEIGMMLSTVSNSCINQGFEYLFDIVNDNYVKPRCNNKGISVIPVTNFEYEKFVADGGYDKYYVFNADKDLNEIATDYYKIIFDFIISALSGNNRKDSNCLARLLKGYGWDHYRQIAYLFSRKEDIDSAAIYKAIGINYPDQLLYPAKWSDEQNTDKRAPFCNPLQPVVCINIFEARAYSEWLASKIGKPVRVLNYDPDYLSVIGDGEESALRKSFKSHIHEKRDFINTVENDVFFYGINDIKVKEPYPVALPNSEFQQIYDFVGNVFETQDTPFTYNYTKNDEKIKRKLKKIKEVYIDYNCPGGGLQRTMANWPPEYMGQVPAFLRNQDIGFRIVIDTQKVGSKKYKSSRLEYARYAESIIETFTRGSDSTSLLNYVHLEYADSEKIFRQDFLCSDIFLNENRQAIVYTQKDIENDVYKESILLVQEEDDIYAYHLVGITSVISNANRCKADLKMIIHKPDVPKDLASRRKMQNRSYADWIDTVELVYSDDVVDSYIAYPINISNGYLQLTNRNIRKVVCEGQEYKKHSALCNSYKLCFKDGIQGKSNYYDKFRNKLGTDFFLPDWIDIVDFIKNICLNMSTSNPLDIGTVMAAISTIDTADLHEQINKKILKTGEEERNEE